MSCRYQVRIFESTSEDGATSAGTIVKPTAFTLSVYAYSGDEAEKSIRKDIAKGKLASGRVYQIMPALYNFEFVRSVAFASDGSSQRVFLDPASGPFCEFRRIRLPHSTAHTQTEFEAATSPC
ncbi:MAG: hypothetical protein JO340_17085 [Acidobacteriaceae bacterium]|nr:hypothetical protein [Acidobacteriaceae bacterium]